MRILVAVKRVIDYNVKVRVKSDLTGVETSNVKMSMNPFDEIAVEEAVRIKESGKASEIVIVSIGNEGCKETIRTGLALGADRGVHVVTDSILEPIAVAKILNSFIEIEIVDLVIMGKQAIDDDYNQTGQILSAILNWPQGTFSSEVKLNNKEVTVVREVDGGLETLALLLPAVITTDLRLNEPRYASLPNIMKAKQKSIVELELASMGIDTKPRLKTIKVEEPAKKEGKVVIFDDPKDLIKALKDKEGII